MRTNVHTPLPRTADQVEKPDETCGLFGAQVLPVVDVLMASRRTIRLAEGLLFTVAWGNSPGIRRRGDLRYRTCHTIHARSVPRAMPVGYGEKKAFGQEDT